MSTIPLVSAPATEIALLVWAGYLAVWPDSRLLIKKPNTYLIKLISRILSHSVSWRWENPGQITICPIVKMITRCPGFQLHFGFINLLQILRFHRSGNNDAPLIAQVVQSWKFSLTNKVHLSVPLESISCFSIAIQCQSKLRNFSTCRWSAGQVVSVEPISSLTPSRWAAVSTMSARTLTSAASLPARPWEW